MHLEDQQKFFICVFYILLFLSFSSTHSRSRVLQVQLEVRGASAPGQTLRRSGGLRPRAKPSIAEPPIALSVVPLEVMGAWAPHLTLQEVWGASAPGQILQRPHSPTREASATPCRKGTSTDGG